MIVETTPEMDALNAVDGRGGDYEGKTLVLPKAFFRPKFQVGDRRFYCTGGFGAKENAMGRKMFGVFLSDGERATVQRGDVEGLAVNQVAEADIPAERRTWQKLPVRRYQGAELLSRVERSGMGEGRDNAAGSEGAGEEGQGLRRVHVGTCATDMGGLQWEEGAARPKLMERVRKGVIQEVPQEVTA